MGTDEDKGYSEARICLNSAKFETVSLYSIPSALIHRPEAVFLHQGVVQGLSCFVQLA